MKKSLGVIVVLLLLALGIIAYMYYPRLNLITGFAAKNLCSCVYEAGREPESVVAQDNNFEPVNLSDHEMLLKKKLPHLLFSGLRSELPCLILGWAVSCFPLAPKEVTCRKKNRNAIKPSVPIHIRMDMRNLSILSFLK